MNPLDYLCESTLQSGEQTHRFEENLSPILDCPNKEAPVCVMKELLRNELQHFKISPGVTFPEGSRLARLVLFLLIERRERENTELLR